MLASHDVLHRIIDHVALIVTIAGVIFSGIVNARAARITSGRLRKVHLMCAWLSVFYVPAYASALIPGMNASYWSSFMLGFSWVVWWGPPWTAFAMLVLHEHRKHEQQRADRDRMADEDAAKEGDE